MNIARENTTAKLVAGFVGFAMAFTFAFAGATSASAQDDTIAQLQAQIEALQAQLAALSGDNGSPASVGAGCSVDFTQNLSQGDSGSQVMQLQQFLNANGYTVAVSGPGSTGNETSFFGPATHQAVVQFQNDNSAEVLAPVGLANGTGFWGPSSRAHANAMCETSGTTGGSDDEDEDSESDSGPAKLEGGAGSIDEAEWITRLNNEDVGEDEDDVEVAGLDIEADDTSDIEITAVALDFDLVSTPNSSDDDFDDYAESVSVWFDGEKIAEVDADKFEDDDDFSQTISLDRGAIIRAGDTEELIFAVSGISNLDDASDGARWNIGVENVRFRDGQNAVITDSSTEDIGDDDNNSNTDDQEREFQFEDFAGASDLTFQIREGSNDDINDARVVEIDDDDETDNVEILRFELDIEGNSSVFMDDIPVEIETNSGTDIGEIVQELSLWIDGEEVGSESVTASTSTTEVLFDDLGDYELEAGEHEVSIKADVEALDDTNIKEGDTLMARFSESIIEGNSSTDLEDASGEDLDQGDIKGAAESEFHLLFENAFNLTDVETDFTTQSTSDSAQDVKGIYNFEFDVDAFGADIYIATTTGTSGDNSGNNGVQYKITGDTLGGSSTVTDSLSVKGEDEEGGGGDAAWKIAEGDTESFVLTVNIDNTGGTAGVFGVEVDSIKFRHGDESSFSLSDLGDFFDGTEQTISDTGAMDDLDITNQSLNA